jgi:1,2-diacylglycerol 3-alpha-glucosyltransferase
VEVTLFSGAPLEPVAQGARRVVLPCLKRSSVWNQRIVRCMPGFAWRWGLKDTYSLEQVTFWHHLAGHLKRDGYHFLHVQDPRLASLCRGAREKGTLSTREILANGTEESPQFLAQFPRVQHLLAYHLREALDALGWHEAPPGWFTAPNFVDVERFSPAVSQAYVEQCRAKWCIPAGAFVVGAAGALKRSHKRMDYLVHEVAAAIRSGLRLHLVLAGARERETADFIQEASALLGEHVTILPDLPYARMPDFYRALDVFVLASLFEMMGIVFAEAMAAGVPVLAHEHPVLREVVGPGGRCIDMREAGAVGRALALLQHDADLAMLKQQARAHVERVFSTDVVLAKYLGFYRQLEGG